jgi:hypothetical protein
MIYGNVKTYKIPDVLIWRENIVPELAGKYCAWFGGKILCLIWRENILPVFYKSVWAQK